MRSFLMVAKKLSAIALSQQSPLLIERPLFMGNSRRISLGPRRRVPLVHPVLEAVKEVLYEGMLDRLAGRVGCQILRSGVCAHVRSIHQHVIPALVLVRLRLVLQVPLSVSLARFIAADDNTPIAVTSVPNQLAGFEYGPFAGIFSIELDQCKDSIIKGRFV